MSNRHELGNMIFNLEERQNLKEVKFTKRAVKEVLSYLKELYEIKNKEHEEDRKVAYLEAKLSESEEKINMLEEHKFYADNIIQAYADKCKNSNQDKISFAVEQLSQTIKNIKKCNYKDFGIMYQSDAIAVIDNQIKELKEGK